MTVDPPSSSSPRDGADPRSTDPGPHAGPGADTSGRSHEGVRAVGRGVRGVARGTGRFGRFAFQKAQKAAKAQGADESGLSRLIELHAVNAAGDAAVAISLATTIFFAGATSEARGQVALFLGLTMLPFAIVAPLIGPFLDRFSHGRRWAIGATFAIRGFLCWVLAGAVADNSNLLYPAALGVLVSSKAYGVTRAAAVPRLRPEGITLVKANGRVSLAGVVGAAVCAPIAGLAAWLGSEWCLRWAFLLFVLGTIAAIRLPSKVDSAAGEVPMRMRSERPGRRGTGIPASVAFALRANCGPRWMSGFLTMFMAFLLRENPVDGWRPEFLIAVVIGAAGAGNTLGILTASLLKRLNPSVTVVAALLADAVMAALCAMFYGVLTMALMGLTAGLAQSLAKVSLDSTIQRDVPQAVQASAFARSDTTLQLSWVVGGFVGIALPLNPTLGLGVATAALAAWAVFVLGSRPGRSAARPTAAPGPAPEHSEPAPGGTD